MKPIILGSSSPRRKEILSYFSIPFETYSPPFDEESHPFPGDVAEYAQQLSEKKALSIPIDDQVIITADTMVAKDGKGFGKPKSEKEAMAMLRELNGSWHSAYTALTCRLGSQLFTDYAETKILFQEVSEEQLEKYHKAFNGLDKAGGYGIQMGGSIIVKQIEGCFYNVMGMPLVTLQKVLQEVGIDLWHYL